MSESIFLTSGGLLARSWCGQGFAPVRAGLHEAGLGQVLSVLWHQEVAITHSVGTTLGILWVASWPWRLRIMAFSHSQNGFVCGWSSVRECAETMLVH